MKLLEAAAYLCTRCGGNAYIAYVASKPSDWDGKVKPGERICLACGRKAGLANQAEARS